MGHNISPLSSPDNSAQSEANLEDEGGDNEEDELSCVIGGEREGDSI